MATKKELSDSEKIEYLKMELEDVYESNPLQIIEIMVWEILDLNVKDPDDAEEEMRNALEVLYRNVFYEEPEKLYEDMLNQK